MAPDMTGQGIAGMGLRGARATLLAVAALGLVAAARADEADSAAAILPGCRAYLAGSQDHLAGQGICLGRIAVLFYNADRAEACPPADLAVSQAIRVVVAWLDRHRDRWQEGFGRLGAEAFAERWPCPDAPRPAAPR